MAILKGLSFPLKFSSRGSFATTSGMDKIKENIRALVLTSVGERVMNPNIGTMDVSFKIDTSNEYENLVFYI